jgi:hypothetical protein
VIDVKGPQFFSLSILAIAFFISSSLLFPLTTVSAAGYDVSIASADVTIYPTLPMTGDIIEITALIRNSGDNAVDVNVTFYLGTTVVDKYLINVVPVSASAKGHWNTTGVNPGTYMINITVVGALDTNQSNNKASASITLTKRPTAVLVIESVQASPSAPVDGNIISINATMRNDGDANATVNADFLVDNVSLGKAPLVLPFGTKKNVTLSWNTTGKEGKHQIAVTVGSIKKTLQLTVAHRPMAVFEVTRVWISDKAPTEGRDYRVSAEIKNVGDEPGEAIVVFKDNTRTYATSKPKVFMPGENHTFSANWNARRGNRVLRVEVQDHPEAQNFMAIKAASQGSSSCGFTILPGFIVLGGCVGLVRWVGPRKKRAP